MEEFVVPLDQQQNGSTESATDEQQVLEDQQPTASQASGRHNVRDPPITSNLFLHIGTRLSSERISGSEDLSQDTRGVLEDEARQKCLVARQQLLSACTVGRWLEYQHLKLRSLRRVLRWFFGIFAWFPLACAIMTLPLCILLKRQIILKHIGLCLIVTGAQWVIIPLGSFLLSCRLVPRHGTANLLFFLPTYLEVFVVGCHVLPISLLLIQDTEGPQLTLLHRIVLVLFLHLCFLTMARVVLIRTAYPLLKLIMILSAVGAVFYTYLLGTFHDTPDSQSAHYKFWTSSMGPMVLFSVTWILLSVYLILVGRRNLKSMAARKHLGSDYDFSLRFMASVLEPPFLLTRRAQRLSPSKSDGKLDSEEKKSLLSLDNADSPTRQLKKTQFIDTNGEVVFPVGRDPKIGASDMFDGARCRDSTTAHDALQNSERLSVSKPLRLTRTHAALLSGLKQGYFAGALGAFLLSFGSVLGGIYIVCHVDVPNRPSLTAALERPSFAELHWDQQRATNPTGVQFLHSLPFIATSDHVMQNANWETPLRKTTRFRHDTSSVQIYPAVGEGDTRKMRFFQRSATSRAPLHSTVSFLQRSANSMPNTVNFAPPVSMLQSDPPNSFNGHQSDTVSSQQRSEEKEDSVFEVESQFARDLITVNKLVGSSVLWWLWTSLYLVGLMLLTPAMMKHFGVWMEYVCFGFLSCANRNMMEDLKYPEHDLLREEYQMTPEERKAAKQFIRKSTKHAYRMFFYPSFSDCYKPSKREDQKSESSMG